MRLTRRRALPFLLVICVWPSMAAAQTSSAFRVDSFTTEQGLPSQAISDVVQTGDGFVWIATGGLLARFDGYEFRSFSAANVPAFKRRITYLHAGIGDTLWILDEGGAVFSLADGTVAPVSPPSGLVLYSVVQDGRGILYGVGRTSVWRLQRGGAGHQELQPRITVGDARRRRAMRDALGRVWVVDSAMLLRQVGDGAPAFWGKVASADLIDYRPGDRFLAMRSRGNRREGIGLDGRVVFALTKDSAMAPVLVDDADRVWVVRERGYDVYDAGHAEPVLRLATGAEQSRAVAILGESGCVWASGLSLFRVCPVPFRTVTPPMRADKLLERGTNGTAILWDSAGRVVSYEANGRRRPLGPPSEALRWARVFVDPRGRSWWSPTDVPATETPRAELASVRLLPHRGAYKFAANRRDGHAMWYAAGRYVYQVSLPDSGKPAVRDSVLSGGKVTAMSVATDGSLWATINRDDLRPQLLHIVAGRATTYSPADGLPDAALRAVLVDDDGTVWIGTYGGGVVCLRGGRFRAVTEADGLGENVVTSLLDDDAGNLWMSGNRSVHRVARADLAALMAGTTRRVRGIVYGRADGLTAPETVGFPGMRDDAGRLWFPTIGGAAVVDPSFALDIDRAPPRVHVLGLRSQGDSLTGESGEAALSRGSRRLSFRYTGIAMRNSAQVRYEYRIDGVDAGWVAAGAAREATYNYVGPGTHTFRVRATNAGGVASVEDATLQFTVPPLFRETPAFYALLVITLASLVWVGVRVREREARRREGVLQLAVNRRTAELQDALRTVATQADQLRSLDEAKSRFFANVSHEFRTPLSLIIGPVEDLRDGRAGELPVKARGRLDGVLANSRRLLTLVEQLLDVARLESGTLHLSAEPRDLVPLLRRMADSFASLAERRGITFRLSCSVGGLRVRYDPDQMEKIISNLVGNALKFTPAGGAVELRASTDPAGDGAAVIEVQDTGPGIAPEYHARVFDRFFQVDDSSRRAHEGTGIGLALVRELVELHAGSITLQSALGEGSTFVVRFPLAPGGVMPGPDSPSTAETRRPAEVATSAATAPRRASFPDEKTVLVVEDNVELLQFLREHLEESYRVLVAENGVRALEIARAETPDLIISDVMMPDMDGQSLCEAVKGDTEIDYIPVILLTAKASRDSRLAGLAGGADDYLTKPVDLPELLLRAENLIASRRRVRERWRAANHPLPSITVPVKAPPRDASERALLESLSSVLAAHLANEDFNVEAMASAMGMGRSTLYRRLEPLLGMSPMDALWEYRLSQAAQWLAETAITVSEVAYGVGFKSVPHFCGKFRDKFGETPTSYRRARATPADQRTPPAGPRTASRRAVE